MQSVRAYLDGSPREEQARLKECITAAVLAVALCRRCVAAPGSESQTVAQLREYLRQAIAVLQDAHAAIPEE